MDPIRYTLQFSAPHTHYVEVRADVPTSGRAEVELMMAVWTPGSYLIREYERHVENVAATGTDGASLAVSKTAKNRWAIVTGGAETIVVTYRVYSREMSVRTNWIESGFALINGAPTFLTLADSQYAAPRSLPDAAVHVESLGDLASGAAGRRRTATARRATTCSSIHPSWLEIRRCTTSRSTAGRIDWSTKARRACSMAHAPCAISSRSRESTIASGARCRTAATSASI